MASKMNKLNVFLSTAAVMNIKIHNLHWNVVGPNFMIIHKFTEELYQMFQEQFDTVAEVMKMQDEMPLVKITDYLKNSVVEETEGRDFTDEEVLTELENDCISIMDLAKEIRDEADKKDNFMIANLFEEYLAVYNKHAWMIRAMLQEDPLTIDDLDEEDDTESEDEE